MRLTFKKLKSKDFLDPNKKKLKKNEQIVQLILSDTSLKTLRYFNCNQTFYLYNKKGYYEGLDKNTFKNLLIAALANIGVPMTTYKIKVLLENIQHSSVAFTGEISEYINKSYISFNNGIFNSRTLTLEKHNPEIFVLNYIDCEYDATQLPVQFLKYLNRLCNNSEKDILLIRSMLRCILEGNVNHNIFFCILTKNFSNDFVLSRIIETICQGVTYKSALREFSLVNFDGETLLDKKVIITFPNQISPREVLGFRKIIQKEPLGRKKTLIKTNTIFLLNYVFILSLKDIWNDSIVLLNVDESVEKEQFLFQKEDDKWVGPLAVELSAIIKWVASYDIEDAKNTLIKHSNLKGLMPSTVVKETSDRISETLNFELTNKFNLNFTCNFLVDGQFSINETLYKNYISLLQESPCKKSINTFFKSLKYSKEEILNFSSKVNNKVNLKASQVAHNINIMKNVGIIQFNYKHYKISPRIGPTDYSNSIFKIKRKTREWAFDKLNRVLPSDYIILELDLSSSFYTFFTGIFYEQTKLIRQEVGSKSLWDYVKETEFNNIPSKFNKDYVKKCIYCAFLGGKSMRFKQEILKIIKNNLCLTDSKFKKSLEYPSFVEEASFISNLMDNSKIVKLIRETSTKLVSNLIDECFQGPTGHVFSKDKIGNLANYIMSYEFFFISNLCLKLHNDFLGHIEILLHLHDGVVIIIDSNKEIEILESIKKISQELALELNLKVVPKLDVLRYSKLKK